MRLALGYAAVLVAAVTFYLDWTLGWAATKRWTAWAVAAYFLLNGAFTWWIWRVEAGAVFEGADGAGQQVSGAQPSTPAGALGTACGGCRAAAGYARTG